MQQWRERCSSGSTDATVSGQMHEALWLSRHLALLKGGGEALQSEPGLGYQQQPTSRLIQPVHLQPNQNLSLRLYHDHRLACKSYCKFCISIQQPAFGYQRQPTCCLIQSVHLQPDKTLLLQQRHNHTSACKSYCKPICMRRTSAGFWLLTAARLSPSSLCTCSQTRLCHCD